MFIIFLECFFRSELAVTAAASIAAALNEMGQQIGLISNGRDAVDRIRAEGWQGDERTREQAQGAASMSPASDRMRPLVVPTRKGPHQHLKILQTLARLELTDSLSFPQLVIETSNRFPRDATIVAILSKITLENAIALGALKRQGFSVMAIVNQHSEETFAQTTGPLLGQGISVAHLKDETSIRIICEKTVLLK